MDQGTRKKRHQPFLDIIKAKSHEHLSPLGMSVLSGAPLDAVKDAYNMEGVDHQITTDLIYDAYLYGVSNEDGVLDFLWDNYQNDDEKYTKLTAMYY